MRGPRGSMGGRCLSSLVAERVMFQCWCSTLRWTCRSPVAEEGRQAKTGAVPGGKAGLSSLRRRGAEGHRIEAEAPAEEWGRGRRGPGSPHSGAGR